jgi:hypothetical protein
MVKYPDFVTLNTFVFGEYTMALLVGNEDNAFHGILCAWNLSGESKIQQKKYI